MRYYINNDKIIEIDFDLSKVNQITNNINDRYGKYIELNQEQIDFYLNNSDCSVVEIFNCARIEPQKPTIQQLKDMVWQNYQYAETSNITAAGVGQIMEWCIDYKQFEIEHSGTTTTNPYRKALAIRKWVSDLYNERDDKLIALDNGDDTIDPNVTPSLATKPYSFMDIRNDVNAYG